MYTVRCLICRLRLQKLKFLHDHYLKFHSKTVIIRKLMEQNSKQIILKYNPLHSVLHRNKQYKTLKQEGKISKNTGKINKNQNKNSKLVTEFDRNKKSVKASASRVGVNLISNKSAGRKCKLPSKIKKKKVFRRKKRNNLIKKEIPDEVIIKKEILIEEKNESYSYNCVENDFQDPEKFQTPTELRLATSDTESCSETSKNSFVPPEETKLFCNKCGSGYKTEVALFEHMYLHEPFCRLCNTWFPNMFVFKHHMQLHKIRVYSCYMCNAEYILKKSLFKHFEFHMEEKVLDDVLDMEEQYESFSCNFLSNNYHASINNIVEYLTDDSDSYCNYKIKTIVCDICYEELFLNDYEEHLNIFHNY